MPPENAEPQIDVTDIKAQLLAILTPVLEEITSPQLEAIAANAVADGISLARMKAGGADPELVATTDAALKARLEAIKSLPELIAAEKAEKVFNIVDGLVQYGVSVAFAALRAYIPLPAPTQPPNGG